jgi:hypothetical protein
MAPRPSALAQPREAAARGKCMDIFDTRYLGTQVNQSLDAPPTPEQNKSMNDAAAWKPSEVPETRRIDLLEDDDRLEAGFIGECRTLDRRVH